MTLARIDAHTEVDAALFAVGGAVASSVSSVAPLLPSLGPPLRPLHSPSDEFGQCAICGGLCVCCMSLVTMRQSLLNWGSVPDSIEYSPLSSSSPQAALRLLLGRLQTVEQMTGASLLACIDWDGLRRATDYVPGLWASLLKDE